MFNDINELLHSERGERLAHMPKAKVMLSAGCSGAWYFDWVEQKFGLVEKHIGLEFYSPRPPVLPANVEWIANTVADMHDIPSSSVDLVFSGQNLEHVWPDEAVNFFMEAARVVRMGGHLVVDSPNRLATQKMMWSHPEHTVEFTSVEVCRAINAAGFNITSVEGIWQGLEPVTGLPLPHIASDDQAERIQQGRRDPDNAFIWWVEAIRADRAPDMPKLREIVVDVFLRAWADRRSR